jgi:hypothetical protein
MFICPYCGTHYLTFQPNCQNCGGPIQETTEEMTQSPSSEDLPIPPTAPRQISNRYVWRLLVSDGKWIAALILGIIGFIFINIGIGLIFGVITAFIGIIFLLLGLGFLGGGALMFFWSYQKAMKVVYVLRDGDSTIGKINAIQEDYSTTINEQHPWMIDYEYQVNDQTYTGRVTTMHQPGQQIQTGKMARILYLASEPQWSSIYPHP